MPTHTSVISTKPNVAAKIAAKLPSKMIIEICEYKKRGWECYYGEDYTVGHIGARNEVVNGQIDSEKMDNFIKKHIINNRCLFDELGVAILEEMVSSINFEDGTRYFLSLDSHAKGEDLHLEIAKVITLSKHCIQTAKRPNLDDVHYDDFRDNVMDMSLLKRRLISAHPIMKYKNQEFVTLYMWYLSRCETFEKFKDTEFYNDALFSNSTRLVLLSTDERLKVREEDRRVITFKCRRDYIPGDPETEDESEDEELLEKIK